MCFSQFSCHASFLLFPSHHQALSLITVIETLNYILIYIVVVFFAWIDHN